MDATTTKTLRLERTLDCTPAEIWAAWTEPERFAKWWNPQPGLDAEVHELDARPSGRLLATLTIPPAADTFGTDTFRVPGTFLRLDPPHELRLRLQLQEGAPETLTVKLRLEPADDRTRLTLVIEGEPGPHHDEGLEWSWRMRLDKLATLVRHDESAEVM